MSETAAAFRQARQDYRQHFRPLVTASALLSVPLSLVILARELAASAWADWPVSAGSDRILWLVQALVGLVSSAAVALLAADLRAGGTWGWREAWARAFGRMRPIVTGHLAGAIAISVTLCPVFMPIVWAFLARSSAGPETEAWLAVVFSLGVFGTMLFLGAPIMGLLAVVTSVERVGGFAAVGRSWRILRGKNFRRSFLTIGLAQMLVFVPNLCSRSLPFGNSGTQLLGTLFGTLVAPFVVLVTLSVYGEARDASGAGAAQLRADLDAR